MDEERKEDLNPRGDDIEEKVRQMLDPSIPDVPELGNVVEQDPDEQPDKIIVITPSKESTVDINKPVSAPELPVEQNEKSKKTNVDTAINELAPSAKGSKKVIIPISHSTDEATESVLDPLLEGPKPQLVKSRPTAITKINIADNNETPNDIAEKLDKAIAGLEPISADKTDTTDKDNVASAPPLESADPQLDALSVDESRLGEDQPIVDVADIGDIIIEDPAVIIDPETDKAVAEIIAAESDEILEIEDAVRDSDEPVKQPKKPRRSLGKALVGLLRKPAFIWLLISLIVVVAVSAMVMPRARYFILNTAGVRASSSVVVLDDSTHQPLKNVQVSLGGAIGTTNGDGKISLSKIRLGKTELVITKRAFAPVNKSVTVGWGSNPLGEISLTPTGSQYTFVTTDALSGKNLAKVATNSGQADAVSDEKGLARLTIEPTDTDELLITFKAEGYRDESITINADDKSEHLVKFVPAKKHVYVSKRSGKFDIYSAYIDGKDEKIVLAASGNERDDMVLVPHPKANMVAYVSTRAGQRNSDGFVMSNLLLINLDDNDTKNIGASEQIKIISWSGDRLIYVQIAAGASAVTPDRYRLMSYNYQDNSSKELAKSNFFNDVIGIGNTVYYAPSSAYQTGSTNFYRINVDGTNNDVLQDKEVWNIFRINYDNLALSVQQQWYNYRLGEKQTSKLNTAPADQISRVYIDSPDGKHSAWIDNRDGKGVVLSYDVSTKTEKSLLSESGVTYPVHWLSDSVIVYRVKNAQETADYAVSIDGGSPLKIKDVTNSTGLSRWLY